METPLFSRGDVLSGDAAGVFGVLALVLAIVLARQLPPRRHPSKDVEARWTRAGIAFSAFVVAAWWTGVLDRLLQGEVVANSATGWFIPATIAVLVLEVVAYWVIWPIGTFTLDRPAVPAVQAAFGAVWGLAQGLAFLSLFAAAEIITTSKAWAFGVAFLLISAFQGVWHDQYWDVHVSPEHNMPEWNVRKVLICHIPNITASLAHLWFFESPALFVLFQAVALTGSTMAMRFPVPPALRRSIDG